MNETRIIKNIPIKIDEQEVCRYLGHKKDIACNTNLQILKIIKEGIKQAYPLLDSKGIYRIFPVKSISTDGVIKTEQSNKFFINKDTVKYFKNSQYLIFAVATIGSRIEYVIQDRFEEKQYLQAMILDAAGTVAIKTAGLWLNRFIEKENEQQGFQLSRYFEPGSGDWDIKEQKKVFTLLQPEKIGVTLNSHYMMHPTKSLSWIRGMGESIACSYRDEFSCNYCTFKKCSFRKNDTT